MRTHKSETGTSENKIYRLFNNLCKSGTYYGISKNLIFLLMIWGAVGIPTGSTLAQEIVMPHNGTDTVYVNRNSCVSILDPGGTSKYFHDENSWLYVISTDGWFEIEGNYEVGPYDDGNDYIEIYPDTNTNYSPSRYGGIGNLSYGMERALIHFHTNHYGAYDGYRLNIRFNGTTDNPRHTILDETSVRLTWEDSDPLATQWKVVYFNDDRYPDSITVNTKNATLTGLDKNCRYRYYITNDQMPCAKLTLYGFTTTCDAGVRLSVLDGAATDTLETGTCYRILPSTGETGHVFGSKYGHYSEQRYISRNGEGFYVRGTYNRPENHNMWFIYPNGKEDRWLGLGTRGDADMYCPYGVAIREDNLTSFYDLQIVQEDRNLLTPTVGTITGTSATISWTHNYGSGITGWKIKYSNNDIDWDSITTTTTTTTLTGLVPGNQYIYTIEPINGGKPCTIAYRHSFITPGTTDQIIMPYRGCDTMTINTSNCLTILDPGGEYGYFKYDNSFLRLESSDGEGFKLSGWTNINNNSGSTIDGESILLIYTRNGRTEYSGNSSGIEINCPDGWVELHFTSKGTRRAEGFEFHISRRIEDITNLRSSNITSNSATLSWEDNSSATQWSVHYGPDESQIAVQTVTTKQVNITGLSEGTQYIWWVENNITEVDSCHYNDRKGFITDGLDEGVYLMPFRGIDTVFVDNSCITIWGGGGEDHHYFNNDTSILILMSQDGTDFYITGEFIFDDETDLRNNGYDGNDRLYGCTAPGNISDYYWEYDAYNNSFYHNRIEFRSENGYLRIMFRSNSTVNSSTYRITVHKETSIDNERYTQLHSNDAVIEWNDNSGANSWTVWYAPENSNTWQHLNTTTKRATLNGLTPNTLYKYAIASGTGTSVPCLLRQLSFKTLDQYSIVMPYRGNDTVYITPYHCYTIYDAGGAGDYRPNDTATLTIISTNGQGFHVKGYSDIGCGDYADLLRIPEMSIDGWHCWDMEGYLSEGHLTISVLTNEAIQGMGLELKLNFYPSIYNADLENLTDNSATIVWEDSSSATQWYFTYGPDMDSLQTITVNDKRANLTGLRRNQQYYYTIENNTSYQNCVLPTAFAFITPCDNDIIILPYHNRHMRNIGNNPLYSTFDVTVDPALCVHLLSNGVNNSPFPNWYDDRINIYSLNGEHLFLDGSYDWGNNSFLLEGDGVDSWYSGHGNTILRTINNNTPAIYFQVSDMTNYRKCGGFDFKVYSNYPIYDIHHTTTGTSATLGWSDTSSATNWTIVYGPSERADEKDSITVTAKQATLTSLEPDQQYICYIRNNQSSSSCMEPVRYTFCTTADTTIIIMPFLKDSTRILNINECYTLKDPGADHDYFYNNLTRMTLKSDNGDPITIRGWAILGDNDYLRIIDPVTWTWFWDDRASTDIHITSNSGELYLEHISAGDTNIENGFEFHISFNTITNLKTSLMTDTSCRVTWDDHSSGTAWHFWYGDEKDPATMTDIPTTEKSVHLSGLIDGKKYYVFVTNNAVECIDTTWFEFCAGGDDCIDYADLYNCHTKCRYGRFSNPDEQIGAIDYGAGDMSSRHTVMTDPLETDPRTGGGLRCVPEGAMESVRLGNWDYGGQAESITYEYIVDTLKTEALLMKYAAVLENPDHTPSDQPRFRLSIVDENDNELNPDCYTAYFVSSDALGWNTYVYDTTTVLWKDWTSVGVDLAPFHGQRIFIKLTTYDCNQMGHFGYAYFTLECMDKEIHSHDCGITNENTFTAPEGFNYEWFNVEDPTHILSTERVFSTDIRGTYKCRVSFLGTSGNCSFEKTAIVGDIFPYAQFDYEILDTIGCEVMVQFINRSIVTEDSLHTIGTQQECEQFVWDFGDGDTSYEKNPRHIFPAEQFNVTLTAMLSNGSCNDDTTMTLLIPSPCITYDTIDTDICDLDTLWVRGTPYTTSGEYLLRTEFRADSIQETFINLRVHPVYDTSMNGGICNGEAYTYFGFNENTEGDYINHQYTNIYHCDSIYRLHLVVAPVYDTVTYPEICDNASYQLRDSLTTIPGIYIDSLHSIYMCDSVVTVNLTVHPTYYNTHPEFICDNDSILFIGNYYKDSGTYEIPDTTIYGCDSTEVLQLTLNSTYEFFDTNYFCQHTAFTFDGWDYTAPDEWDIPYLTGAGCDSIYHMVLNYYDSNYHAGILLSIDSSYWFGPDTLVGGCAPFTLYLKNDSQGDSILTWYFGDGDSSSIANTSHVYDTGNYTLTLVTLSPDGCLDTLKIIDSIRVYSRPVAGFTWDPPVLKIPDPEITLINTSRPDDSLSYYLWNIQLLPNGDYDTSTAINPHYTFSGSTELLGMHEIMLVAYLDYLMENGKTHTCTDTISDSIKITNTLLQFPNLVTPNGDGHNDTYVVINLVEEENYPINRLTIYDRWGNIVYDKKNISDLSDFWDPNLHNNPDGTYYYRFHGQGRFGHVDRKGAIEVIRGEE